MRTQPRVNLNLLVLRTARLSEMRTFYSALGMRFTSEQHGNGPEHFAALLDNGVVLELYPTRDGTSPDLEMRIGFSVENIEQTLRALGDCSTPRQTQWGLRALVHDPDGRTVELAQSD